MLAEKDHKLLREVGQRIRAVRRGQGLNLEQIALLTGISAPALSLIETAKRDVRLTTFAKIATALRVPLSNLLDDKASNPDTPAASNCDGYDIAEYL